MRRKKIGVEDDDAGGAKTLGRDPVAAARQPPTRGDQSQADRSADHDPPEWRDQVVLEGVFDHENDPEKRANPPNQANNFTPMNASQLNGVAGGGAGGNGGGSGGGMLRAGGTSFCSSGTRGGESLRGVATSGDGGIAAFSGAAGVSLPCDFRSSAAIRSVNASIV